MGFALVILTPKFAETADAKLRLQELAERDGKQVQEHLSLSAFMFQMGQKRPNEKQQGTSTTDREDYQGGSHQDQQERLKKLQEEIRRGNSDE